MLDQEAVLFANEAFYAAFANRDVEAMDDLWSRQAPVRCIHPGWAPLEGRAAVMRSWENILTNPQAPRISCCKPTAVVLGSTSYVICYELVEHALLVATNIFVHERGNWKLVHHHAAAAPQHKMSEAKAEMATLQ